MIEGTVTFTPTALPEVCDAVYLLDDADIDGDAAVLYEATLDGGDTWEAVTPGQIVGLGHDGDTLQIRATLSAPEAFGDEAEVRWVLAYATQEA